MTPGQHLTLRREALTRAVGTLPGQELRVFLAVVLGACPRTRRAWTTALRLCDELAHGDEPTASPSTIDAMLTHLVALGHLELWSRGPAALRCYEVPALRSEGEPPANLPVEPDTP